MKGILLMNSLLHTFKQKMRGWSIILMRLVIKQPQLKQMALFILTKIPNTKAYFNTIALSGGLSTKQDEVKLTELSDQLGSVSITNSTDSTVNNINYFSCHYPQQICQTYGLNFDFQLIEKIRRGQGINFAVYAGDQLKLSIAHFYLALLYRFPTTHEIEQRSANVISQKSFEPLIKTILNSTEYKQRGRKEMLA